MKKKICFVMDSSPEFLGGVSVYVNNIIKSMLEKKFDKYYEITCLYPDKKNNYYEKNGIKYVGLKTIKTFPLNYFVFGRKVSKYLQGKNFEIINSHGLAGYFMKYFRKNNEKIIHVYHGTIYNFYKTHFYRNNILIKMGALTYMALGYLLEKPPINYADKIISISKKCSEEMKNTYGLPKKEAIVLSGTDVSKFIKRNKWFSRKALKLDKRITYFLYIGRGGPWRKGLDRAINLTKNYYKINKKIKLIVVGADPDSCKEILDANKKYVTYFPIVSREKIPYFYSACDAFLCCSRYEGNPLVVGEALASSCFACCSKDIDLEILDDQKNCLILEDFSQKDVKNILNILNNKQKLNSIGLNARKTIERYSLEKWGREYLEELLENAKQ